MKLLSILTAIVSILPTAVGQGYQCQQGTTQYLNQIPVDISYQCCSESQAIFATGDLEAKYDTCIGSMVPQTRQGLLLNFEHMCDHDGIKCVVDLENYLCDEAFQTSCTESGGVPLEGDFECLVDLEGADLPPDSAGQVLELWDGVTCLAPSCTPEESTSILDALAGTMSGGDKMQCKQSRVGNQLSGTPAKSSANKLGLGPTVVFWATMGSAVVVLACW